jgi:hypothetical protein
MWKRVDSPSPLPKNGCMRISPLALALLASITTTGYGAGRGTEPTDIMLTSQLLAKAQCDRALPGYAEKARPYYQEWRTANRERINTIEASARYKQQKADMLRMLPGLSARAATGIKRDCAAMLTQLAADFLHPQTRP